ncbi:hypothetical protein NPIL_534761 [Nephila pilipes]|uniref:Uncharacterized protein n=1 Tax=Nephila pilipes TaxID=299642 RepID=A0A8X6U5E1_NEPPI|nr:hypothetical protein NPIL_534761 [Nephila pilipes]
MLACHESSSVPNGVWIWIQNFVDKMQHQRWSEAQYLNMIYIPPEDVSAERVPEIIPLSFPERTDTPPETIPTPQKKTNTSPERILNPPVETFPVEKTLSPRETLPELSPSDPITLKPVERTPFLP